MKTLTQLWNTKRDALIGALVFTCALALYARTLAPSIVFLFDDTLEMQYVVPRLGILHPTGYPLYTLLGKLFTLLVPLNDPAFRLNLFSAFTGALAVAMVYLVARRLVAHHIAAIAGALIFAVGKTFWEQAVAAEVYALQMLLAAIILYLTLRHSPLAPRSLYALAFAMGLGLTHHRLIVLLYPAIALYVLLVNRSVLRDWKTLARAAFFFILPLALYLYLPLRGAVGSADGAYQNTLQGFIEWITASQYAVFLSENPFQVQRDAAYYWEMFRGQFTIVGLALAGVGVAWLARKPREWALLVAALIAQVAFAFNYRVADVEVHFLTTFLLLAIFAAGGADALLTLFSSFQLANSKLEFLPALSRLLFALLLLLVLINLLSANYAANDLSTQWTVHDGGLDILGQSLEDNATIIGIVGEMTRLRYFQETRGLRTDVQTIGADKDDARLDAIANALAQNRAVYTTRPLKGLPERYALSSLGTLIRVHTQPVTRAPSIARTMDENFGNAKLIGYNLDASRLAAIPERWHAENGRVLRVTLYWQVEARIENDAQVSIKIVRKDQRVVGQADHRPVQDAYPTNAWRKGEVIADTYDVPLFLGITPSEYSVNVTMYDPRTGDVIGQSDLETIPLDADVVAPRRAAWNIAHLTDADFGALSLVGFSLGNGAQVKLRPGDALPLTLLWRAGALKLPDDLQMQIWFEDAERKTIASRDAPISVGYPPFLWQPNVFVRDAPLLRVPANVVDGRYAVKLAVARDNQLLGSTLLPFRATIISLGNVEIKNRPRVMQPPEVKVQLEANFDKRIRLLGYDVKQDAPQRAVSVTLWWKALALMDTSYTAFVHLLDGFGQVRASADAIPGNGDLPTTGWIEDEYITDVHIIALPADLPAGAYQIEIGLYDPTTGARLKTAAGQDFVILTAIKIP